MSRKSIKGRVQRHLSLRNW